jgi:hypothetical protein
MSCCSCALVRDVESCDVFPARYGFDLSSVCSYFDKISCERCKKFRNGGCILGLNNATKCGEFSRK